MSKTEKNGATISTQLNKAAFKGQEVTKESVVEYLTKDISGVYLLMTEIMNSKEIIEAIAQVIFDRYEKTRKAKEAQLEIQPEQ